MSEARERNPVCPSPSRRIRKQDQLQKVNDLLRFAISPAFSSSSLMKTETAFYTEDSLLATRSSDEVHTVLYVHHVNPYGQHTYPTSIT
jgi:hypothetical protein